MDRTVVWILALCAMTSEVVANLHSSNEHGHGSTWVILWYFRWIKLGMHMGWKFEILLERSLLTSMNLSSYRCRNEFVKTQVYVWELSHTDLSDFKTLHGSKDLTFISRANDSGHREELEQEHDPQIHLAFWNWHEVGIFLSITIFLLVSSILKVVFHKMHWLSSRIPESWLVYLV